MRIVGEDRKAVYDTFENVYYDVTDCMFSWQSGEKSTTITMFNRVAENLGIRDEEKIDKVMEVFEAYLEGQIQDWFTWDKGNRENLFGFIDKKENIELFVNQWEFEEKQDKAESKDIAGTQDNEEWEW